MSRYIDADKMLAYISRLLGVLPLALLNEYEKNGIDIVRCKECWHGTDIKNGKKFCIRCDIMDDLLMIADGFCNFGEREGE